MGIIDLLSRLTKLRQTAPGRFQLPLPPLDFLRQCFWLDEAGVLRWRVRQDRSVQWNGHYANRPAGGIDGDYRTVGLLGKRWVLSRIVYALSHDKDPGDFFIDHIDGNSLNDHPRNLRLATNAQNISNARLRCDNHTGHRGVVFNQRLNKWIVQVGQNNATHHVGCFDSLDAAVAAAKSARKKYFGEFYRG